MRISLRVATFLCEQCHHDTQTVYTVWQEGQVRQLWCATCLGKVRNRKVQIAQETCQQCHCYTEATSDVFWYGSYQIWCSRCVEEQGHLRDQAKDQHMTGDEARQRSHLGNMHMSLGSGCVTLLKGRYRLIALIGKGGFGAVYKAEDTIFARRLVAVKEMIPGPEQLPASIKDLLEQEALMLARLMHAQLPRIYDYFTEQKRYYLVMDYIEGLTLEQYAKQAPDSRLPLVQVLGYGIQLCNVLEYLHSRKPHPIIFRDLKPSNIIVGVDGILYLIDFGIARFFKVGQAHDTMSFVSPGYAAPEQYGQEQTTVRTDIYSLGATLHRLLSGINPARQPFSFGPFSNGTDLAMVEIEHLVRQMVSMEPSKRPAHVAAIRQELQHLLARLVGERSAYSNKLSLTDSSWSTLPENGFSSDPTL
ncbi:MAG TPA: serine/threonine-protein kinase [Ktedonobacteraceae bacterium]